MNSNRPRSLRIDSGPEYQMVKYSVPFFEFEEVHRGEQRTVGALGQLHRLPAA